MTSAHLDTELIPYLRGELAAQDVDRLSRHLAQCAHCREDLEGTRQTLAALRAQAPDAPDVDWRRYRAELRRKLDERSVRRWSWSVPRLVPVAATAVAGLALVFTLRGGLPPASDDPPPFEQTEIGTHLELLRNYPVVENLDLFEDFEVVQSLDDLDERTPVEEG